MALGDERRPDGAAVDFPAQGRTKHILARYCLRPERLEAVVERFLADGSRLDAVGWEEL
jgi:hypothetical protein